MEIHHGSGILCSLSSRSWSEIMCIQLHIPHCRHKCVDRRRLQWAGHRMAIMGQLQWLHSPHPTFVNNLKSSVRNEQGCSRWTAVTNHVKLPWMTDLPRQHSSVTMFCIRGPQVQPLLFSIKGLGSTCVSKIAWDLKELLLSCCSENKLLD